MNTITEDEYERNQEQYDYDDELTQAENIIASRRLSYDDFDDEYFYAIVTLSYRVKCPACTAKKRQACRGTSIEMSGYHAPCHKSRLRLLEFKSSKVNDNLRYAMRSKKWKGDWVLIKQDGEWFQVYCKENDWRERVKETYGI
jgi:hypothetical protein